MIEPSSAEINTIGFALVEIVPLSAICAFYLFPPEKKTRETAQSHFLWIIGLLVSILILSTIVVLMVRLATNEQVLVGKFFFVTFTSNVWVVAAGVYSYTRFADLDVAAGRIRYGANGIVLTRTLPFALPIAMAILLSMTTGWVLVCAILTAIGIAVYCIVSTADG